MVSDEPQPSSSQNQESTSGALHPPRETMWAPQHYAEPWMAGSQYNIVNRPAQAYVPQAVNMVCHQMDAAVPPPPITSQNINQQSTSGYNVPFPPPSSEFAPLVNPTGINLSSYSLPTITVVYTARNQQLPPPDQGDQAKYAK